MSKTIEFHHGALADSYEEQANTQGFTFGDMADIEVVIKVDERDVDFVRKNFKPTGYSFIPLQIQNELISAILNGTILPKGHGRLKDIDWIDDNCENHYSDKDGSWCYRWKDIEGAPTIIDADKESEA